MESDKWNVTNGMWEMQCDKWNVTNALEKGNLTIKCDKCLQSDWIKSIKNPLLKIWKSIGLLEREV